MSRHHRVHELLDRGELDELESFAREPGRTVDEVHEWLQARGYTISRSGAHRWLREFLETDRFRASNEVARTILDAAKNDTAAISDAAMLKLGQMLFEQLLRMQEGADEAIQTKELWAASMALKNVVMGKRHIEKLQQEVGERQKKAIEEAQKVASTGGKTEAVISKVREILGV